MADGSGPAAVSTILRDHGSVPVIFVTGNPEALPAVASGQIVLTKPVNLEHLTRAIAEVANGGEETEARALVGSRR